MYVSFVFNVCSENNQDPYLGMVMWEADFYRLALAFCFIFVSSTIEWTSKSLTFTGSGGISVSVGINAICRCDFKTHIIYSYIF